MQLCSHAVKQSYSYIVLDREYRIPNTEYHSLPHTLTVFPSECLTLANGIFFSLAMCML